MWIALPFARSLAGRFVRSAGATALAAAALVTVAALVEGHPPRVDVLARVVGPLAGALGACWALGAWRGSRADVAAASLGWRDGWPRWGLVALAAPLLATSPPATHAAAPPMTVTADAVVARLPEGPVTWRWRADGVHREGPTGAIDALPPMPRPRPAASTPQPPPPWRALLLRLAVLALALRWLAVGAAPGPPRVVAAAVAAFVAGHGLAWWLG